MGVEIISFYVDGTLVEPDYNDLIWQKVIPELVAKKENIDSKTALQMVQREYDRIGDQDIKWYDIQYWIQFFHLGVDHKKLLQKYQDTIRVFPEVTHVMDRLAMNFDLICISSMPREFLQPKIRKIKKYFQTSFSTLSDYHQLKNTEIYRRICQELKINPSQLLHIGDHEKSDYLAAREAGIRALLIDRCQQGYKTKYHDDVIFGLTEILTKLDLFEL